MNRSSSAKRNDRVVSLPELLGGHAQQRGVDADVVTAGQSGAEPDAELDERRDETLHLHLAGVLAVDAGHDLQQRALAAAVRADDAEELTAPNLERHVVYSDLMLVERPLERMEEMLLERRSLLMGEVEALGDVADLDCGRTGHTRSAIHGSSLRKIANPIPRVAKVTAIGIRRPAGELKACAAVILFGARSG